MFGLATKESIVGTENNGILIVSILIYKTYGAKDYKTLLESSLTRYNIRCL